METGKANPKFTTIFTSNVAPDNPDIEELIFWAKQFHEHGLAPSYGLGSYGNLSFRSTVNPGSFIITVSALELKDSLNNNDFCLVTKVDYDKLQVYCSGKKSPSSETMLHSTIYAARQDINAIFHGHSTHILNTCESIGMPQTDVEYEYGTIELVNSVKEIALKNDFFILKNHGFISLGNTMDKAGKLALKYLAVCEKYC